MPNDVANYCLSDTEKFRILVANDKYSQIFINVNHFSKETEINYQTVYNWLRENTYSKIQLLKKLKIEEFFNLNFYWRSEYDDQDSFIYALATGMFEKTDELQKQKEKCDEGNDLDNSKINLENIDKKLNLSLNNKNLSKIESKALEEFRGNNGAITIPFEINNYTSNFLFEFAKVLKNKNQIEDALNLINQIEQRNDPFKYYFKNHLLHLRAILLSHDTRKEWDKAIDILNQLYVDKLYLNEPEVITLLASNYKRKALYHSDGSLKDTLMENDINDIGRAMSLYEDAMNLYKNSGKQDIYYPAINLAYLYKLTACIEENDLNCNNDKIKELFESLGGNAWNVETADWWEKTSKIEFYILMGNDKPAEELIDSTKNIEPFEIDATIRQLDIYAHFCKNDTLTNQFFQYIKRRV